MRTTSTSRAASSTDNTKKRRQIKDLLVCRVQSVRESKRKKIKHQLSFILNPSGRKTTEDEREALQSEEASDLLHASAHFNVSTLNDLNTVWFWNAGNKKIKSE